MVASRQIFALLLACCSGQHVSIASASSRHYLRASSSSNYEAIRTRDETHSNIKGDIVPSIAADSHSRHIQEEEEIYISNKCLSTLEASANDNGHLYPDEYLIFSDGMSNGYYTLNNITTYTDLPYQNKYAFVTLSCQCEMRGGSSNCCQGPRANLNVQGINSDDPDSMDIQLQYYITLTMETIGDDILPPTERRVSLMMMKKILLTPLLHHHQLETTTCLQMIIQ